MKFDELNENNYDSISLNNKYQIHGIDKVVNTVSQEIEITEDENLHRHGLVGFYGSMEGGWAVLDVRNVLAGSF